MIKKVFIIFLAIMILTIIVFGGQAQEEQTEICNGNYVMLEVAFNQGVFTQIEKTIETGCFSQIPIDEGDYSILLKQGEEIIYQTGFNQNLFLDADENGELTGDVIEQSSGTIYIQFPETENSETLEVYNPEGIQVFSTISYNAGAKICKIN